MIILYIKMKDNLPIFIFLFLIIQVQLHLKKEKRQELLSKLTKKISYEDLSQNLREYQKEIKDSFQIIKYNVTEIKLLMEEYKLPLNYNFFNETGAIKDVKNQGSCESSWSFAASSSLAYRFKKYGINISLSPQDGLSCYFKDCKIKDNEIDPLLNLVKNGSVSEECFPYTSIDENIPECPNQCQDGTEFEKYYAQNAYVAYNKDRKLFNELVILIMDQLFTQGPVTAGINIYNDFDEFGNDKEKCENDVYTSDEASDKKGRLAITIVGYGLLKEKFYWLVQNSRGPNWCDNGFIKIEINQCIDFSFAEPKIIPEQVTPVEVNVNLKEIDGECNLIVDTPSLDKWKNTLEIHFQHETRTENNVFFQLGKNKIKGKDEINCNYEIKRLYNFNKKGKYIYKGFQSLGEENTFKINYFEGKFFYYYGKDFIIPLFYGFFYVSQPGSKIIFIHEFDLNDETMPQIYMDENSQYPLSNCLQLKTSTQLAYSFGYCQITQDELNYIENNGAKLWYSYLCGILENSYIAIYKLDTKNYPVFKVNKFLKPNATEISKTTDLIIVAKVEGGTKFFTNEEGIFRTIFEVENNNQNKTFLSLCSAEISFENIESNLICHLSTQSTLSFQNIYLLPFSLSEITDSPFEVFINRTIKAADGEEPEPTDSDPTDKNENDYLYYSLNLLFGLMLLF